MRWVDPDLKVFDDEIAKEVEKFVLPICACYHH